ncbi:MAG: IS66 family insertion sequence element accessory protein TnpB [Planctomycetota bacterium]|nr:IS66 family insertion sequence element accessory protein TnpB [Planctomycetota bacterium]
MLTLPSLGDLDRKLGVRVFLHAAPTDMRKGFDSLAALVREGMGHDPLSGHLFLFISRRRDRIKLLYWDRDGYALWYKRLEQGTFRVPRTAPGAAVAELTASELAMLLDGIDLRSVRRRTRFRIPRDSLHGHDYSAQEPRGGTRDAYHSA